MSTHPSRTDLRKALREQRRALAGQARHRLEHRLLGHLLRHRFWREARHIALYLPNDGEVDLSALIDRACGEQKTLYLPVLRGHSLRFAPVTPRTRLRLNRFGIPEPALPPSQLRDARRLDLILMPLVGFDEKGNRLGMGGGFYDRSLAFMHGEARRPHPRLVGVAFERQRLPALPHAPWDVPLRAVLTESRLQAFARSWRTHA